MSMKIGGNDPVKGIVAICEFLAAKGQMSQTDFDEIVRKMRS